jgi:hypothetical protein
MHAAASRSQPGIAVRHSVRKGGLVDGMRDGEAGGAGAGEGAERKNTPSREPIPRSLARTPIKSPPVSMGWEICICANGKGQEPRKAFRAHPGDRRLAGTRATSGASAPACFLGLCFACVRL